MIRVRVNNTGDQLEGAHLLPPPSRTHALQWASSLTLPPLVWQAGRSTCPTCALVRCRHASCALTRFVPCAQTDFVQSFVSFPPPPAAAIAFESDTAVVVNGALVLFGPPAPTRSCPQPLAHTAPFRRLQTTYNNVGGGVVVALESQLDNEVERGRRVERARQGWGAHTLQLTFPND